jgi:uncharacterized protein (DUF433 family)
MNRITIDPAVQHGKPVVRGTRVPVDIVVGSLAGGMTYAEIETEYGVTLADIQACLKYAAHALSEERLFAEVVGR